MENNQNNSSFSRICETIQHKSTCADVILHQIQETELYYLIRDNTNRHLIKPFNKKFESYYGDASGVIFSSATIADLLVIRKIINQICKIFNKNDSTLIQFKNDALVDIFVLKHCVIKFYTLEKFDYLEPIFNITHPNIEKVLFKNKFDKFGMVVSKKLTTLDKIECIDQEKLRLDISSALDKLEQVGYIHNDTRLDNIGVNSEGDFVLFDFGISYKITPDCKNLDIYTLEKSIKYKLS